MSIKIRSATEQAKDREGLPNGLFKFQSLNINSVCAIQNRAFWFSSIDKFNDPFELAMQIDSSLLEFSEDVTDQEKEKAEDSFRKLWEEQNAANFGICCLFTSNNSHLQWAHYGDSHKGFCIGINPCSVESWFHANPNKAFSLLKVFYSQGPPGLKIQIPLKDKELLSQQTLEILRTKSLDWKHENEWRVISPENANKLVSLGSNSIESIYFGARMAESHKQLLVNATVGKLKYFDTVLDSSSYEISFQQTHLKPQWG